MTCKDCLYNKNCQFLLKHKNKEVERCTDFEDKSQWVHLPCKVFDDVYLIHNGSIERCVVEGIHYTKKSSYVRLRPYHQDYLGNWSKYFTPSIHSFVKTAFFTIEEAEKALDKQRETLNGGRVWVENENSQKELKIHNKKG